MEVRPQRRGIQECVDEGEVLSFEDREGETGSLRFPSILSAIENINSQCLFSGVQDYCPLLPLLDTRVLRKNTL